MTKALCLLAAIVVAAPAAAQTAPAAQPAPVNSKKSDVNKLVCQRQEEIGSRLNAKKVCMTVQEWQEFRSQNRENLERWQQSAGTRTSG
jgi:invasion protein IalB